MAIMPAPAIEAPLTARKSGRDTGIDLLRALCVIGVVLLHSLMVGVTVTDAGPVFSNASDNSWWIVPVSWMLQIMPLFFIIGGFAGLTGYHRMRERGEPASAFVAARIHRLLRPALFVIGFVGLALAVLALGGVPSELITVAGFRFSQPLWFLGVFLLCQALLPVLAAAHKRAPLRTLAALIALSMTVDALRAATGIDGIGFVNLAFVWMTLQQFGFFFADGSIDALSRRARWGAAIAATGMLVTTFITGIYSPDLIANINPPTCALLLVGVVHLNLVSLFRDRIAAFSARPRIAHVSAFVNARTMTIYLWHMPVLLTMAGVSAAFAIAGTLSLPDPGSPLWWDTRPLWLSCALAVTAAVALSLARFENSTTPTPARSTKRLVLACVLGGGGIVLLLTAGTSPLTAAMACAALLLALRLARTVAPSRRAQPIPRAANASPTMSA